MDFVPVDWQDRAADNTGKPRVSAANLDRIEAGVAEGITKAESAQVDVTTRQTEIDALLGGWKPYLFQQGQMVGAANDAFFPVGGTIYRFNNPSSGRAIFRFDPAWAAIPGFSLKLRIHLQCWWNTILPGINVTAAMRLVTGIGGASGAEPVITGVGASSGRTANLGLTLAGQSVRNTLGPEFDAPAAAHYALDFAPDNAPTAGATIGCAITLLYRHVRNP